MEKKIQATALLFGFLAIVFGAFGAHALKAYLSSDQLISFETGVRYQMYHAFFLLFVSRAEILAKAKKVIFYLTVIGVILFSFSIYLLATKAVTGIDFRCIGFITPIGGFLMILAWLLLFLNIIKKKG
ncbi:DUF423 domain-containing protein [Flavobacterium sp. NST-5]|uniref:DUF423 domain-containing protein n=1 Tax=Flavobacterium ichthyis TaxID=2698827 RepID=A0ABW9ZEA7_9FLAO|nr:DUF423 domain-containing protein [Flavobacterium ichthyis]NBL66094.1 DUF423 domain-containing protein [Flavobacterium ichthyis]